jgi:hypothetical protein
MPASLEGAYRNMSRKLGALLVGLGICAATSTAFAAPAFTAGKPSANLRLQYGIDLEDQAIDVTPYGLGFAAGGGYTLDSGLYIGGAFDYFLGGSKEAAGNKLELNVWQLMGTVGYDLGLGDKLVLRPYAGAGIASWNATLTMMGIEGDESETDLALAFGAAPMLDLGGVFLLADARLNMIFADPMQKSILIGAGAGMTF